MTRHIVKSSEPQEPVTEWSLVNVSGCVQLLASNAEAVIVIAEITRTGKLRRIAHADSNVRNVAKCLGIPLDATGRIAMED